jgi:hypothetical protein
MAIKYYMQFVLHGAEAEPSHYSGVVELENLLQGGRMLEEIEAMLADNFEVEARNVRVIHWARLH